MKQYSLDSNGSIISEKNNVSSEFKVPSLGSQNHTIVDERDLSEALHLMNYAYQRGLKDKSMAISKELLVEA